MIPPIFPFLCCGLPLWPSHSSLALAIRAAHPATTVSPPLFLPEIDPPLPSRRHLEAGSSLAVLSQGIAAVAVAPCPRRAAGRIRAATCPQATVRPACRRQCSPGFCTHHPKPPQGNGPSG